ncbi:hypothetical protein ACET3Z_018863 [Daucus carota]
MRAWTFSRFCPDLVGRSQNGLASTGAAGGVLLAAVQIGKIRGATVIAVARSTLVLPPSGREMLWEGDDCLR